MYWEGGLFDGWGDKEENRVFVKATKVNKKIARNLKIAIKYRNSLQIRRIRGSKFPSILGRDDKKYDWLT